MAAGKSPYHFIEVMSCPGGCIGGGGQPVLSDMDKKIARNLSLYAEDLRLPERKSHLNTEVSTLYTEFLGHPAGHLSHETAAHEVRREKVLGERAEKLGSARAPRAAGRPRIFMAEQTRRLTASRLSASRLAASRLTASRRGAPFLDKVFQAKYYANVKIKAVGFDLDGTLYPAWSMFAVSADLGIRHPFLLRAFSQARKRLRTRVAAGELETGSFGTKQLTASEAFKARQTLMVAKSLGADPAPIAQSIDATIYSAIEKRFFRVKPYPGVADCLEALRRSGLPLGFAFRSSAQNQNPIAGPRGVF